MSGVGPTHFRSLLIRIFTGNLLLEGIRSKIIFEEQSKRPTGSWMCFWTEHFSLRIVLASYIFVSPVKSKNLTNPKSEQACPVWITISRCLSKKKSALRADFNPQNVFALRANFYLQNHP